MRMEKSSDEASSPTLSIIVPSHNEQENLPPLVDRLAQVLSEIDWHAEVILVDDHSSDATEKVADNLARIHGWIHVSRNHGPRGMGSTLKTGLTEARGKYVCFVMADGVDDLTNISRMVQLLDLGQADIAISSRYMRPGYSRDVPHKYKFWSTCFRLASRILLGVYLKDPTNAYRCLRRELFSQFKITANDFSFSAELTFKAWKKGLRIVEIPGRHGRRIRGRSSFSFRKVAWPYVRALLSTILGW